MKLQRVEFDAHYSESIQEYAKRAVEYLLEKQKEYKDLELYLVGTFNGVKVITTKISTVDSIVGDYHARIDDSNYEYRQTDEYRESVAREERELSKLNVKAKNMMERFDKIDKKNKLDLINWLDEFQPLSDHVGVLCDKYRIISELQKAGYVAGMNCNKEDVENATIDEYADWLIGQCLDGLENIGAIHSMVCEFAKEYRKMLAQLLDS